MWTIDILKALANLRKMVNTNMFTIDKIVGNGIYTTVGKIYVFDSNGDITDIVERR